MRRHQGPTAPGASYRALGHGSLPHIGPDPHIRRLSTTAAASCGHHGTPPREAGCPGVFHAGNGFSRSVLEAAGIDHTDTFVAVTSCDNSNIVSARTAKETYQVPTVLALIHDPRRADIYRELGIPTVSGVRWAVNASTRCFCTGISPRNFPSAAARPW
ncbi:MULTISPECIES: NAD-binding protein [unclassified Streptomyces]|uniref:NAD-binding protein n=1 Tax=unclassified Streptomyces TaxID=2593676 RepID=UPI00380F8E99